MNKITKNYIKIKTNVNITTNYNSTSMIPK